VSKRFDRAWGRLYSESVRNGTASGTSETAFWWATRAQSYVTFVGRKIIRFVAALHALGAFALISFGVLITKFGTARSVVYPIALAQLVRAGLRLLPMVMFLALALGLVIIGQTVSMLSRVGATEFLGTVMATVVVRELGPLLTAIIVVSRAGTANVVELGTARALGEVEALEVMGIDPIHYLVVPRMIAMALSVFALTIYLILGALVSGYLWAFLQDVPLQPGDYLRQLAASLRWIDFVVLGSKTFLFGVSIAIVTCYHGLARMLRLEEVSRATVRAVAQTVVVCVLIDALFIVIYLTA
jgi:phospholipid/cholesterol/gamma-HCH transport system permease protein